MVKGRPRAFDTDKAVAAALQLFRAKGYEGTSIAELARAMGIAAPSLYAAFGSKEGLFRRAMDLHADLIGPVLRNALAADRAVLVASRYMHGSVDELTALGAAPGCLFVQGALACGDGAGAIRDALATAREGVVPLLAERFEDARNAGELSPAIEPTVLARAVATMTNGLAVQAAGGLGRAALHEVVDVFLAGWPQAHAG